MLDSSLMTALTPDLDVDTTSASASSPSPAAAPAPETTSTPITGDLTPPADTTSALPLQNLQPAAGPPNPKLRSVLFNHIKGLAIGMALDGIPGAVVGAVDPQGMQRQANMQAQAAQAKITFANAQAAHEVVMAHQADVEYQALPEKLQQEAEGRGLDNIAKAKQAGYLPIASIPLDQGTSQNAANAKAALDDVKSRFGQVPSGLLYIHTGSVMTVMKLQDQNAVLPTINQTLRAQGQPELSQDQFSALAPQDRDNLARQALTFTSPVDTHGEISQDALNMANARLLNVKAQPAFTGQDQLVSQLQQTVDHYQSVLDSGAGAAAIRAGKAKGAEAQAAQPGTTAAQVANINATAGPEANAAGLKAGAEEAAKFPYEVKLKQMEQGQDQGFAVNPQTGQRELIGKADAQDQGFKNWSKASQGDIEKETNLNAQLNELQLNTSRYKVALQNMGDLSQQDVNHMARILSDQDVHSVLASGAGMGSLFSILEKGARAKDWNELSPDKQEALMGALRMRNSALLFQKVATGMGRASKEAMDIELQNMPDPFEGATVGLKKLGVFQENVDQMASRSVKLPWMQSSADIKSKVESSANAGTQNTRPVSAYYGQGRTAGTYKATRAVQAGDKVSINGRTMTAGKVFSDGSFDAQ